MKSKLSKAKKSKTATFSRVFHPKIDNFHRKSKLNFWTKNEDFEQCAKKVLNEDQTCEFINYCLAKCETCLVWTLAGFNAYVDKTTQQLEVIHDLAAKMAGKLDEY